MGRQVKKKGLDNISPVEVDLHRNRLKKKQPGKKIPRLSQEDVLALESIRTDVRYTMEASKELYQGVVSIRSEECGSRLSSGVKTK